MGEDIGLSWDMDSGLRLISISSAVFCGADSGCMRSSSGLVDSFSPQDCSTEELSERTSNSDVVLFHVVNSLSLSSSIWLRKLYKSINGHVGSYL